MYIYKYDRNIKIQNVLTRETRYVLGQQKEVSRFCIKCIDEDWSKVCLSVCVFVSVCVLRAMSWRLHPGGVQRGLLPVLRWPHDLLRCSTTVCCWWRRPLPRQDRIRPSLPAVIVSHVTTCVVSLCDFYCFKRFLSLHVGCHRHSWVWLIFWYIFSALKYLVLRVWHFLSSLKCLLTRTDGQLVTFLFRFFLLVK